MKALVFNSYSQFSTVACGGIHLVGLVLSLAHREERDKRFSKRRWLAKQCSLGYSENAT
jgi:hypothetical protein